MPPDASSGNSSPHSVWKWCFESLTAVVTALILTIIFVIGNIVHYVTIPDGGIAVEPGAVNSTATVGDKGPTILTYEVFNPGPGELPNIHLEIDVEDGVYDEEAEKFSTGLTCQFLQATSGAIKTNGKVTSITAMPHTGGKCCTMSPGDSFSVALTTTDAKWQPKRVDICYSGGGVIDILKKPFVPWRCRYPNTFELFWIVLIFFIVVLLICRKLFWRLIQGIAEPMSEDMYDEKIDKDTLTEAQFNDTVPNKLRSIDLDRDTLAKAQFNDAVMSKLNDLEE